MDIALVITGHNVLLLVTALYIITKNERYMQLHCCTCFGTKFSYIEHINGSLQGDFTLMMSVTLVTVARNVLMDLLSDSTKRQEHRNRIASPALKVTVELSLPKEIMLDISLNIIEVMFPFVLPNMSSVSLK